MRHIGTLWPQRIAGVIAGVLLLSAFTATALAQSPDRVRLTDKTDIIGEIIAIGPVDVEITDQRDGESKKVSIDRIVTVAFGGEPDSLRNARNLFMLRQDSSGAFEELGKIEQVELDGATDNVLTEVAFLKAATTARQATVTGAGLEAAEKGLREFLQKHPRSHHVLRSQELLGDLLVRAGKFTDAATAYAALEKGPPAFRVRAATSKAASFYEQKKYAEAEKEYAAAAATQTDPADAASARQKREAQTGRARCLARQAKAAEAVKIVQGVIREADPDDREFLGRAYAALGDAFRAAAKDQDAIIAFLTVDLVYNSVPESHAEALSNLVQLWQKVQNPERSREARQTLETTYPDSRWTKAAAAAAKG